MKRKPADVNHEASNHQDDENECEVRDGDRQATSHIVTTSQPSSQHDKEDNDDEEDIKDDGEADEDDDEDEEENGIDNMETNVDLSAVTVSIQPDCK